MWAEASRAEAFLLLISALPIACGWLEFGESVWKGRKGGNHISEKAKLTVSENPTHLRDSLTDKVLNTHCFVFWVYTPLGQTELSSPFPHSVQGDSGRAAVRSPGSGIRLPGSEFWFCPFLAVGLG